MLTARLNLPALVIEGQDLMREGMEHYKAWRRIGNLNLSLSYANTLRSKAHQAKIDALDEQLVAWRAARGQRLDYNHGRYAGINSNPPHQMSLPVRRCFKTPADYASVAVHEHTHATGRFLGRPAVGWKDAAYGSVLQRSMYAREELLAEFVSLVVLSQRKIAKPGGKRWKASARYIGSWALVPRGEGEMDPLNVTTWVHNEAEKAIDHLGL